MEQAAQDARGGDEWRLRFEELDRAYQQLQNNFRQQQKVTNEVKQEATAFLQEMRTLSERSSKSSEYEEKLLTQVQRLEEEVDQWRSRYIQVKGQLQTLRGPSTDGVIQQPNVKQIARNQGYVEPNGFIRHVYITRLQVAIDELLRSSRTDEPEALFNHVRSIFVYARDIIQDAQSGAPSGDDQAQQILKFTRMLSDAANNLATAVRNFSSANGLSPICLIDAAASHVTNSVIALASVAKIKPAAPEELDEEDDNNSLIADSPATYYGLQQYGRLSVGDESIYSSMSPIQQTPKTQHSNQIYPYQNGLSNGGPYNSSSAKPGLGISSQNAEAEELRVCPAPSIIYLTDRGSHQY